MIAWLIDELQERRDELARQQRQIAVELPRIDAALLELGARPRRTTHRVSLNAAAIATADSEPARASSDVAKPEVAAEIPAAAAAAPTRREIAEDLAALSKEAIEASAAVMAAPAPEISTRELVLQALRDRGSLRPRELWDITGRSKPGVGLAVKELVEQGLVHRTGRTNAVVVHLGPAPAAGVEAAGVDSLGAPAAPSPARVSAPAPAPRPRPARRAPLDVAVSRQQSRQTRSPRPAPASGIRIPKDLADDSRVLLAIAAGCRSVGECSTKLGLSFDDCEATVDVLVRGGRVKKDSIAGELTLVKRAAA